MEATSIHTRLIFAPDPRTDPQWSHEPDTDTDTDIETGTDTDTDP